MKFYIYIENRMVAEVEGYEFAWEVYRKAYELADLLGELLTLLMARLARSLSPLMRTMTTMSLLTLTATWAPTPTWVASPMTAKAVIGFHFALFARPRAHDPGARYFHYTRPYAICQ